MPSSVEQFTTYLKAQQLPEYIELLEQLTGNSGALDVLWDDQRARWDQALSAMSLKDPSREELQAAISDRVVMVNEILRDLLDAPQLGTPQGWEKLVAYIQKYVPAETLQGHFIKTDVLQEMLSQHPPEAILQYLGYASVEECLNKESIFEIMSALRFAESDEWMRGFLDSYHSLTPDQFEDRSVEFLLLEPSKWWKLAEPFAKKKKHHFSHLKEVGVIFSYPDPAQVEVAQSVHEFTMMILHYVYEVHFYSQFFKHTFTQTDAVGEVFSNVLAGDDGIQYTQPDKLPIVQQYHAKKENPPSFIFTPHVMPEALHYGSSEKVILQILQEDDRFSDLEFWTYTPDVAGIVGDSLFTLNFADNILSKTEHLTYHYNEVVWNAIFAAYYGNETLYTASVEYLQFKYINLKDLT